jgi:hypothetical protein
MNAAFPSVAEPRWLILNLGMPFPTKRNMRINPPCNCPLHLSVIRLRHNRRCVSGKTTGGVRR